jgi:hypothetical protein
MNTSFLESVQESTGGKNVIGNFYDLTKAYDAINHYILLTKLNSYGVRDIADSWFEPYLVHLKQVLEINCNGNKTQFRENMFQH